jgi:2-hydroxymuconate-semialdehyde hydrolase
MTTSPERLETGRSIAAGGVRTHLHDAGEGAPLLLLHGSGPGVSAWANWRRVLPELARGFRVLAPDQLGFGATERPADGRYGRRAWTEHALAVLDALAVERVSVVGNSMGGAIALSIAAARPALVDRLVLMGTCGLPMQLTPGLDRVWGYTPDRDAMRELVELFAYDDALATRDLVELRYAQSAQPEARASYEAMFPAPRQRWLDDLALADAELARVDHPTLLVHGRDDEVIPFSASLRALDALADAELHAFSRCGHWVQIERSRRFVDVVVEFLRADASTPHAPQEER